MPGNEEEKMASLLGAAIFFVGIHFCYFRESTSRKDRRGHRRGTFSGTFLLAFVDRDCVAVSGTELFSVSHHCCSERKINFRARPAIISSLKSLLERNRLILTFQWMPKPRAGKLPKDTLERKIRLQRCVPSGDNPSV